LQSVNELAVDSGRNPGKGEKLSAVGVAGELQGEAFFFGDLQPVGGVSEQDAGPVSIHVGLSQYRAEVVIIG